MFTVKPDELHKIISCPNLIASPGSVEHLKEMIKWSSEFERFDFGLLPEKVMLEAISDAVPIVNSGLWSPPYLKGAYRVDALCSIPGRQNGGILIEWWPNATDQLQIVKDEYVFTAVTHSESFDEAVIFTASLRGNKLSVDDDDYALLQQHGIIG
jgi:hypothetical protein